MGRPKAEPREKRLPRLNLDIYGIMRRADENPSILSVDCSVKGVGFAYERGKVLMMQKDGFLVNTVEDWRVILEELKWVVEEADRWARS